MFRRLALTFTASFIVVTTTTACTDTEWLDRGQAGPATSEPTDTARATENADHEERENPDRTAGTHLEDLVSELTVMTRPSEPGYERDCGSEGACVFGPAWTDDHVGDLGHDDCDTRNNILDRDLIDVTHRPGTEDCIVETGTLHDPFTGEQIDFEKSSGAEVHVDHVYPLARAWDMGASEWPEERRVTFANDPTNLLAVAGGANSSKSDQGPGGWLPPHEDFACEYLATYAMVAVSYDLPVTPETHAVISDHAPICS